MPSFTPPDKDVEVSISISGIMGWFKRRKKKRESQDIENIRRYEELIKNSYEGQNE